MIDARMLALTELADQFAALQGIVRSRIDNMEAANPAFPVSVLWLVSTQNPAFSRNNVLQICELDPNSHGKLILVRDLIEIVARINQQFALGLSQGAINRLIASHPLMKPPADASPEVTDNADGTRTVREFLADGGRASDGPVG